jgi:inner membrane protein
MPSPVAHSLIGLALGAAAVLTPDDARGLFRQAWRRRGPLCGAVLLAQAPDIDYLPGLLSGDLNAYHHLLTHTAGWCGLVSVGCWLALRAWRPATRLAVLGWCLLLTGSHLLADWLTADARPPIGIMALWPFSDAHYISPATIFMRMHKRDLADVWQAHNLTAVAVELAWCLPLLGLVFGCLRARAKKNAAR